MLENEFKYYLDHQDQLLEKYNGKVLVIIGEEVVGAFSTEEEAYKSSVKKYQLGKFLIQKCTPGTDAYTQTFHSRVVFA